MTIHDKAHELARALKESPEVQEITEAVKLIDGDAESKRMLEDFRTRQNDIQQRLMSGDMPNPEEMEQMEKLFEVLSMNPSIHTLFEAERRLSLIIQDVNKIISDSLEHLYGANV
ncbi:cell fate (sporulation/competence/biofilm development) regulator YlbF (YheA/YmcA/DUF963 family) [Paenibacillus shirakamiensis]|uniref:UPF0342 protein J2Z69_003633 n=1 Tax=Paenibacillus shirakamiensis TaxID=1265935 RepID=A0ABS4JLF5_9BACL|nr:YlbF family regulator [Paenibacillus shirakamiensis]MBP2002547.1 cell fate (sporulation/competence/biofilm development) regulator YlbF (YheA/YmcA/DUF963 family) [Paenibacillus shirakamiensis]